MRRLPSPSLAALAVAGLSACAHAPAGPPLRTVEKVDLARYAGTWYEIATIPMSFQKGCVAVTATYRPLPDGEIEVVNRCRDGTLDGRERSATGRAWPVDASNAKLEVQFFWPFKGDYWIVDLGPDYEYAVVGHPARKYLWILSRTPRMDEATYQAILGRLREQGYDLSRLERTLQPPAAG
jgi:apolipoprotein D and lipocalin family protein